MNDRFEELFQEAVGSYGGPYREARDELVAGGADFDVALQEKRRDEDWRVRLVAEIISGRRASPDRYAYIREVAEGTEPSLEGEKYLTGRPPIDISVGALLPLGTAFLPALLEMLYKEHEEISDYAFWVCTNTIIEWGETRAIPVYRDLLHDADVDPAIRERSIQALFNLKSDGLYDDLLRVIEEDGNPDELRGTAASTLSRADAVRAFPVLVELIEDVDTPPATRNGVVTGLGYTQNPEAADVLLNVYLVDEPVEFRRRIIVALGALGTGTARAALTQIQDIETDSTLFEIIDSKLEDVERH